MFGIFVGAYLLGSLYFWFFGQFNSIVCSIVLRWIGQDFVAVVCDIPAGVAIFHLHHINYKVQQRSQSRSESNQDLLIEASPE